METQKSHEKRTWDVVLLLLELGHLDLISVYVCMDHFVEMELESAELSLGHAEDHDQNIPSMVHLRC